MDSTSHAFDIDVALRTIEEQQHIISSLHELVQTLKQQVQELELTKGCRGGCARSSADVDRMRSTNRLLLEENQQLKERLAGYEDAKGALEGHCAFLTDTVASAQQEKLALEAQVRNLEFELERERKMHQFTDSTCTRLTGATSTLQAESQRVSLEKTRWKALATALAHRMEPAVQSRVLLHIRAMEEEESRQRTDGSRSTAAPPAVVENTSPEVQGVWRKSVDVISLADRVPHDSPAAPNNFSYPAPPKRASGKPVGPLPPL